MLLRSGKLATNNEDRPRRRNTRKMANPNAPNASNRQNPQNSEVPPPVSSTGGNTVSAPVSEAIPSMSSSMPTHSITHSEPILNYVGPRGPPHTPPPIGTSTFRQVPPPGFSMPYSGREQPYGMPTSVMASLHNASSAFSEPVVNVTSPLQGSGSGINVGRNSQPLGIGYSTQMPNLTTNSASYLRQQMDEGNHDMVQTLAQTMGTIFNPLIQSTTQANQQMAAQMTRITDFFGVPQPPRPPQREWIRENQGVILDEDVTINQIPRVANQGVVGEQPIVEPPRVNPQVPRVAEPRVVMVNRNQNADEVVQQIRHDNIAADNNLAAMVERIMA